MTFLEFIIVTCLAISGWIYSSYVSSSASKRSEIRTLCDQIETLMKDLFLLGCRLWDKEDIDPAMAEAQCNQLFHLLEMKLISLKKHTGTDFSDIDRIVKLQYKLTNREDKTSSSQHLLSIWDDCADIIGSTEQCYTNIYTSKFKLHDFYSDHCDIISGAMVSGAILLIYGLAFSII